MRKRMGEVLGMVLSVTLLCTSGSAAASIVVGFDPPPSDKGVGDIFSVDLVATIDGGDSIVSFGLDGLFEAAVLDTVNASVNPSLFAGSIVDTATDGVIDMTGFAAGPLSGALTLATLTFEAEMEGMASLDVAFPDFLLGTDGFGLSFPPGGVVLPDTVNPATVTIVPVPATLSLLASGLVGFVFARRRKLAMA